MMLLIYRHRFVWHTPHQFIVSFYLLTETLCHAVFMHPSSEFQHGIVFGIRSRPIMKCLHCLAASYVHGWRVHLRFVRRRMVQLRSTLVVPRAIGICETCLYGHGEFPYNSVRRTADFMSVYRDIRKKTQRSSKVISLAISALRTLFSLIGAI